MLLLIKYYYQTLEHSILWQMSTFYFTYAVKCVHFLEYGTSQSSIVRISWQYASYAHGCRKVLNIEEEYDYYNS